MIQYLVALAVAVTPILLITLMIFAADFAVTQNLKKKEALEEKRQPNNTL